MHNAGQKTGVLRFSFMHLHALHGETAFAFFRVFIRQLKVREEGREGEPGTVRPAGRDPANK